jgi:hypothetical protein
VNEYATAEQVNKQQRYMPQYINPQIREYTTTMQGNKKCLPWTDGNIHNSKTYFK